MSWKAIENQLFYHYWDPLVSREQFFSFLFFWNDGIEKKYGLELLNNNFRSTFLLKLISFLMR